MAVYEKIAADTFVPLKRVLLKRPDIDEELADALIERYEESPTPVVGSLRPADILVRQVPDLVPGEPRWLPKSRRPTGLFRRTGSSDSLPP